MASRQKRQKETRPPAAAAAWDFRSAGVIAALVVLVAIIYAQVRTHQFINFDDPLYVSKNVEVLRGLTWSGVVWAFTHVHAWYWLPLTWISHMIDVQLFGRDAGAHLLVSAALHAINCALLFVFLKKATKAFWRSAIVAALFAVHPLHVESVAWVAERKDTLSTLFFLLCLIAYAQYVLRGSRAAYVASVAALALGLMAKPMLVTTPFVLLLLDFWPFERFGTVPLRRLIVEKIPFAICVIGGIAATLVGQRGAMASTQYVPVSVRVANAFMSYVAYVGKTIWPAKLAVFYPFPSRISISVAVFDAILVIACSIAVLYFARTNRPLFVGWFWFVGTLVPVIGLAQAGQQAYADRFTYIPHIGFFIAVVWSAAKLIETRPQMRTGLAAAAGVVIVAFAAIAYRQVGYWSSSRTLFEHALAVTSGNNRVAHVNLAAALVDAGDYPDAEAHYRAAMGYEPAEIVYDGLAMALIGQGSLADAKSAAATAVRTNPRNPDALSMLATVDLALGDRVEAQAMFSRAVAIRSDAATEARLDVTRGDLESARAHFDKAIEEDEYDADLRNDYAAVLARLGKDADAEVQYEEALRLNPNLYDAHMNYGALLSRVGRDAEAAGHFEAAARLRPRSPEPHIYLALLQANQHQFADAQQNVEKAIALNHDASNQLLIDAIRIPPRPTAIDEYLAFLRQQGGGH